MVPNAGFTGLRNQSRFFVPTKKNLTPPAQAAGSQTPTPRAVSCHTPSGVRCSLLLSVIVRFPGDKRVLSNARQAYCQTSLPVRHPHQEPSLAISFILFAEGCGGQTKSIFRSKFIYTAWKIRSGFCSFSALRAVSRLVMPLKTRQVVKPARLPPQMSERRESPTIMIRLGSKYSNAGNCSRMCEQAHW